MDRNLGSRMLSGLFLRTQEITELMKLRDQTVRNWTNRQEPRAVRPGGKVRGAPKGFEALVNGHAADEPGCRDAIPSGRP